MKDQISFSIIGGSGLYAMDGLEEIEELEISTPFGKPSSPVVLGSLEGVRIAFLARHGIGHILQPSEVNYRANIFALKSLGIERILSISACGSLREDFAPGDIIIPDQLFDLTKSRKNSFFGDGLVAHIGVADPFCNHFSDQIFHAIDATGATVHKGGAAITIEGPRFSTKAESNIYRSWGLDVIGMTASPEAFLAREAELCYGAIFHITDYDVWHMNEEPVSVEQILKIIHHNTIIAQEAIKILARSYDPQRLCDCSNALQGTFVTSESLISEKTYSNLSLLIGKYFKSK